MLTGTGRAITRTPLREQIPPTILPVTVDLNMCEMMELAKNNQITTHGTKSP
jgi:hypothetical protein